MKSFILKLYLNEMNLVDPEDRYPIPKFKDVVNIFALILFSNKVINSIN